MNNKSLLLTIATTFISIASFAQNHAIGEKFGGGIVFYVDGTGQHGLIAATKDQGTDIKWYNGVMRDWDSTLVTSVGAGASNTAKIVATQNKDNPKGIFAAKLCADYSVTVDGVTYDDWYLPSIAELELLQLQKDVVGGFNKEDDTYWSSSEGGGIHRAFTKRMSDGKERGWDEDVWNSVRAIRTF